MRGLEKQEGLRDVLKPVWFRSKIFIFVVFLLVIISIIIGISDTRFDNPTFNEITIKASDTYEFSWNKFNKKARLKKDGMEIANFILPERPLNIWIYKPKNMMAIITTPKERVTDVHNLYLYSDGNLFKSYGGRDDTRGIDTLYSSNSSTVESLMEVWESDPDVWFSPKGDFLLLNADTHADPQLVIVNTITGAKVAEPDGEYPFNNLYWGPDGDCFVYSITPGYYEGFIAGAYRRLDYNGNKLDYYNFTTLLELYSNDPVDSTINMPDDLFLLSDSFDTKNAEVYWSQNCSGIISQRIDAVSEMYYIFDIPNNIFSKLENKPKLEEYSSSQSVDQENIFFVGTEQN
ncbi:hypothetical protein KJ953_00725 [Patescibacteria group bacterium]|nr:hypothetical protein [Patescibacteria group bacterium]